MWKEIDSVVYFDAPVRHTESCVVFDLDGTLITSKFNSDKWEPLYDNVYDVLIGIHATHDIYIISNQLAPQIKTDVVQKKVDEFLVQLGFAIPVFLATARDNYRKPNIGIWKLINRVHDYTDSLFVGDANGADLKSTTDLKFAINARIRFQPPHAMFESTDLSADYTDVYALKISLTEDQLKRMIVVEEPPVVDADLIILVGPPASTKTSYCKMNGYESVSQDVLKTAARCLKECEKKLKIGNVVVDNTNPTIAGRAKYIAIAKKLNKTVACVFFNIHKDIAMHMNQYRRITNGRMVPDVAIHKYYKSLEEPTTVEGLNILTLDKIYIKYSDPLLYTYMD